MNNMRNLFLRPNLSQTNTNSPTTPNDIESQNAQIVVRELVTSPQFSDNIPRRAEDIPRHFLWGKIQLEQVIQFVNYQLPNEVYLKKLKISIITTYLITILLIALLCIACCLVLSFNFQNFTIYIFWICILAMTLVFNQFLRMRKHLVSIENPGRYFIESSNSNRRSVTTINNPDFPETLRAPPPTYEVAHQQPPAYYIPKSEEETTTRRSILTGIFSRNRGNNRGFNNSVLGGGQVQTSEGPSSSTEMSPIPTYQESFRHSLNTTASISPPLVDRSDNNNNNINANPVYITMMPQRPASVLRAETRTIGGL